MISMIQECYITGIVWLCFKIPVTTENLNLYKLTISSRSCLSSVSLCIPKKMTHNAINPF